MAHGGLGGQGGIGPAELPLLLYGGRRRQSLLRSEPMVMLQLIVQADSSAETVEELGDLGSVMFCDLNEGATAFQRNFVAQMRECDEVERCLRYIGEQVAAAAATRWLVMRAAHATRPTQRAAIRRSCRRQWRALLPRPVTGDRHPSAVQGAVRTGERRRRFDGGS